MGKIPRRHQLTGCRHRLPLRQATSCSHSMHLTSATMGARARILVTRGKMKMTATLSVRAAAAHHDCDAVFARPRVTPSP